jgi:hypothetical protein
MFHKEKVTMCVTMCMYTTEYQSNVCEYNVYEYQNTLSPQIYIICLLEKFYCEKRK